MNSLDALQFMLSFVVQALLLTAFALIIERRCVSARVKTRVWTCYYVSLLLVLAADLIFPRLQWASPWQRLSPHDLLSVIRVQQSIAAVLLIVWAGGLIVKFSQWMLNSRSVQRFLRTFRTLEPAEASRLLDMIPASEERRLVGEVQIKIGPEELGPWCYQFHRPVIILPPSLIDRDDELRFVLQHELEHLRTQHPMQVFTQRLAETILWFLPPVRWAGHRASLAREFVCDDAATSRGASTAGYLRTLLRFAQLKPCCVGVTLGLTRTMSDLRVRAERLAASGAQRRGRFAAAAPALLIVSATAVSQFWLPTNPLGAKALAFSPWPTWSASALHTFGISVRDFGEFDPRLQVYELEVGRPDEPRTR